MSKNIKEINLAAAREDAAAKWAVRLMSGSMSSVEQREFECWRAESASNERALQEFGAALPAIDASGDALLAEEFERQLAETAARARMRLSPMLQALAASLAVIVTGGVIALAVSNSWPQTHQYATAIGESADIALEDGSIVELNTSTKIEVAYGRRTRSVKLTSGEALFSVEKDVARPFVIETSNSKVRVTGTVLNVSLLNQQSRISVISGAVQVASNRGELAKLIAGESVEVDPDGVAGPVEAFDPALVVAWRTGKARFRNTPLGEAIAVLNRYFEKQIVIDDNAIAQLPVTGEFDIRDQETAIRALTLIFGLKTQVDPNRIILTSAAE